MPAFDCFNTFLQSEEPLMHMLLQSTIRPYRSLLTRFIRPRVIFSKDLTHIDLDNREFLRNDDEMFSGAMTKQYARDSDIIGTSQYQKCLRVEKVLYDMHQVLANINVTQRRDKVFHIFKTSRKASLENKSKYPFNEAVNTAVYLRNRSRTTALKEITPYERLFKKKTRCSES